MIFDSSIYDAWHYPHFAETDIMEVVSISPITVKLLEYKRRFNGCERLDRSK